MFEKSNIGLVGLEVMQLKWFFFTIDKDYLAFLESRDKKIEPLPSIEAHLEELEAKKTDSEFSFFKIISEHPYLSIS